VTPEAPSPTSPSPRATLRIGTRGSPLALAQSRLVADALAEAHPGLACQLVRIATAGDRRRAEPLPAIGGTGLFTREIESALLRGEIDLAVHSLKDLPTQSPDGLVVAAVPARAPAADALISADGRPLDQLPPGARIGTSSPRRAAQLLAARPDLRPEPIRGNLDTRIRKLREGRVDALVVALAGLERLGVAAHATQVLPLDVMLPAPGQGALAVQTRAGDAPVVDLAVAIDHGATRAATTGERALLEALGGGCSLPLGAYAEAGGPSLRLRAILLAPDGAQAARADSTGPLAEPTALAHAVAAALRADGADAILDLL